MSPEAALASDTYAALQLVTRNVEYWPITVMCRPIQVPARCTYPFGKDSKIQLCVVRSVIGLRSVRQRGAVQHDTATVEKSKLIIVVTIRPNVPN